MYNFIVQNPTFTVMRNNFSKYLSWFYPIFIMLNCLRGFKYAKF